MKKEVEGFIKKMDELIEEYGDPFDMLDGMVLTFRTFKKELKKELKEEGD